MNIFKGPNSTSSDIMTGYTALEKGRLQGYCIVSKDETDCCHILAIQSADISIADGLLRKSLHAFHEQGVTGYSFATVPTIPLPDIYITVGEGNLADIFTPCSH